MVCFQNVNELFYFHCSQSNISSLTFFLF
uniref:Uncharacterized protein n=1 Tax=Arundo donax TaxID=35708 RepID=A0A0A9GND7_ARUDO